MKKGVPNSRRVGGMESETSVAQSKKPKTKTEGNSRISLCLSGSVKKEGQLYNFTFVVLFLPLYSHLNEHKITYT